MLIYNYNKGGKLMDNKANGKIEGTQVIINSVQNIIETTYNNNFDELIFDVFFYDISDNFDISRLCTDAYGDGGVDYLFFSANNRLILTGEDVAEIDDKDIVNIHFLQLKESRKIDSDVPNKLIELSENFFNGKNTIHYNQEIKDNIDLFNQISDKILPKGKFNLNFYYFGFFDKHQMKNANDLSARFETLKQKTEDLDYVAKTNIYIKSISDIYNELSKGREFEYKFKKIDKYVAEVNENTDETDAVIALIPIKQYYDFIVSESGDINTKLFESNIRDYKGKSSVNKGILDTLSSGNDSMQFWWLNNGITIIAEDIKESTSAKKITIKNPQIVNGLQTSYSIFHFFTDNKEKLETEERDLFVKIIKIDPELEGKELDITIATNRQNEIRDKDIRANDDVQKNIELFFKENNKYYQRKDKYYTNRKYPKKDIVTLFDLAKYVYTIYYKDPAYTRNNPGKLLKNDKYNEIFQIMNNNQDYYRYLLSYEIYERIIFLNKGKINIGNDSFEKTNFIHHLVYVSVSLLSNSRYYTFESLKSISLDEINEQLINKSYNIITKAIIDNGIAPSKVLKTIKEQKFNLYINQKLDEVLNN